MQTSEGQHTVKKTSIVLVSSLFLMGCINKNINKEPIKKIYHAPAQAYNLTINNPTVIGVPTLRDSCSIKGSSLEIRDKIGNYYKVDVINLLADTGLTIPNNKSKAPKAIADFLAKFYNSSPLNIVQPNYEVVNNTYLYIPYTLYNKDKKNKNVIPSNNILGILVSRHKDFLFVVQHVQNNYNKKQMIERLTTIYQNMRIPGSFTTTKKYSNHSLFSFSKKNKDKKGFIDKKESIGFININPKTATHKEIKLWHKQAQCK